MINKSVLTWSYGSGAKSPFEPSSNTDSSFHGWKLDEVSIKRSWRWLSRPLSSFADYQQTVCHNENSQWLWITLKATSQLICESALVCCAKRSRGQTSHLLYFSFVSSHITCPPRQAAAVWLQWFKQIVSHRAQKQPLWGLGNISSCWLLRLGLLCWLLCLSHPCF